jgi:hypothetical protein
VLATLEGDLLADFAFWALHPQHNLFGGLGLRKTNITNIITWHKWQSWSILYLLPENRFGLTTITLLFSVVTTTTLGSTTLLGFLVLRHFVDLVGLAFFAVGATTLWYVHLKRNQQVMSRCFQQQITSTKQVNIIQLNSYNQ